MKLVKVDGYFKTKHPLFTTYKGMLSRCYHKNSKYYSYYGGRGIHVVKRWRGPRGFQHFVKDMGERPNGFTIERVKNNRWYGPNNCTWVTRSSQSLNQRVRSDNSSGYPGIHFFKATNRWSVYIDYGRKRKHLGYFEKLADAIETRRTAEEQRILGTLT